MTQSKARILRLVRSVQSLKVLAQGDVLQQRQRTVQAETAIHNCIERQLSSTTCFSKADRGGLIVSYMQAKQASVAKEAEAQARFLYFSQVERLLNLKAGNHDVDDDGSFD
jgi:hypothetical protein